MRKVRPFGLSRLASEYPITQSNSKTAVAKYVTRAVEWVANGAPPFHFLAVYFEWNRLLVRKYNSHRNSECLMNAGHRNMDGQVVPLDMTA
ncbi:hypothetical protein TcWFU_003827 [Taenia crassiceps]|uniref:Uncharacterized protein n=1 Tax=Taenia crassiceps TaxID=6207 RepID=A0ABR4Q466_9CEST